MSRSLQAPPGLDIDRIGQWLAANVADAEADVTATLIEGGKSNLTYIVTDGQRDWIVRRPPLGHVLATAHDMAREYRVMTALRDTSVPVPRTLGLCEDTSVIGAPFYVMQRCPGSPYRFAEELEALGTERTRAISERLVDTLAKLHAVDPTEVGLGDFGRPEGYLGRQVKRWKTQLDASHSRDLPLADELFRRLAANIPTESAGGIVHGDYRLDNVLVDGHDQITAVLDWEMATLGDPLADLALMLVYGRMATGDDRSVSTANLAPGFLSEDEIVARYAAGSERDLSQFGFYLGLAAFKLAAIIEGIYYRHLQGQTVGAGFESVGDGTETLLQVGLSAMDRS
ncbi:MAG: phosphotransferase family protein [Nocardioidaceae bacterium]